MVTRTEIADFLGKIIFENRFIQLDYWSLIHFTSGLLLFLLVAWLVNKNSFRFILFIKLLIIWELFEFLNWGLLMNDLFRPETITNIIWDVITGIIGGIVAFFLIPSKVGVEAT